MLFYDQFTVKMFTIRFFFFLLLAFTPTLFSKEIKTTQLQILKEKNYNYLIENELFSLQKYSDNSIFSQVKHQYYISLKVLSTYERSSHPKQLEVTINRIKINVKSEKNSYSFDTDAPQTLMSSFEVLKNAVGIPFRVILTYDHKVKLPFIDYNSLVQVSPSIKEILPENFFDIFFQTLFSPIDKELNKSLTYTNPVQLGSPFNQPIDLLSEIISINSKQVKILHKGECSISAILPIQNNTKPLSLNIHGKIEGSSTWELNDALFSNVNLTGMFSGFVDDIENNYPIKYHISYQIKSLTSNDK